MRGPFDSALGGRAGTRRGGDLSEASSRPGIGRSTVLRKLRWNHPGG